MTINLTPSEIPHSSGQAVPAHVTLVGLFEDVIDARALLSRLRKDGYPAGNVSLVVRDPKADESDPVEQHGAVATAVDQADLNGQSDWLLGLASLIVPEQGRFLVAGLLGAALAGVTLDNRDEQLTGSALGTILRDFGFGDDEVTYLESRSQTGAILVAVTSDDQPLLASARKLLSDTNAVHIGAARTSGEVAAAAMALLESPPEVYGASDVLVTDAVAPLRTLINGKQGAEWAMSLRGKRVTDSDGEESGRIENLIVESTSDDTEIGPDRVRYVVISYGGVLGIGRRLAAVPIEQIRLAGEPVRVAITRDILQQAPAFDPSAPFSRSEEHAVCAYFGCTPYWAH